MPTLPVSEQVVNRMVERLAEIASGTTYWTDPALVTDELLPITQYGGSGPVLSDQELAALGLTTPGDYTAAGLTPGQEVRWLNLGPVLGVGIDDGTFRFATQSIPEDRPAYEHYEHELRLIVVGYVHAPAGAAKKLILRLWQDHLRALLSADLTLGGLVRDFKPERVVYGVEEPFAEFGHTWVATTIPIAA